MARDEQRVEPCPCGPTSSTNTEQSLSRLQLRVPLLQKAVKVDHQNHDFLMVKWLLNSKKVPLFFSAGEQEMIMNAYEEYKTIIMATFDTATAVRARCVGMFIA